MDPIRPPDSTRNDCLLGGPPPANPVPRRSRRNNAHRHATDTTPPDSHCITWDHDVERVDEDEEALLRLALEESLREEQERMEQERVAKRQQEEENEREARRQKYGMVVARLRLMRHPSDPVVDEWLERIDGFCNGNGLSDLTPEAENRLSVWLERRRRNSPFLEVLDELLKK